MHEKPFLVRNVYYLMKHRERSDKSASKQKIHVTFMVSYFIFDDGLSDSWISQL